MATHLIANCLILHPILPFTFPPYSRTILPQLPTQPCIDLSQSLVTVWNDALTLCLPRAFPGHTVCSTPAGNLRSEGTRLNSSHQITSYAVFCLKKKKKRRRRRTTANPKLYPPPTHQTLSSHLY